MNTFFQFLLYTVPSLIVAVVVYYIIKSFLDNEAHRRNKNFMMENKKMITPIRLQAYERLILFLERISADNLIPRLNKGNISSKQFQSILLNAIRGEFEHNLSQQLYVSPEAWEMVKNAKTNTVKLINTAADQLKGEGNSNDLAKLVLQFTVELESKPNELAIRFLKAEANKMF